MDPAVRTSSTETEMGIEIVERRGRKVRKRRKGRR